MFVRELADGDPVDQVLIVREASLRRRSDGSEFLRLSVADRSGSVVAVASERARELAERCQRGTFMRVRGRFELHVRYGAQIAVDDVCPAQPADDDLGALLDGPPRPVAAMEAALRDLVEQVRSPHLRALLDGVLGPDAPTWPAFRDAPAAKRYHQAYRHGLLEHSLGVAEAVAVISTTFPGIDRDVAITGALLHDIGKLDAYTTDPLAIDLTDLGKLHGEIALGYFRIRRAIEDIPGFPEDLAAAVLHIILSHHGQLEHGSPVVPCTREATLVHAIDNLGGKLGSFDRLEKELPHGSAWSGYDRALGGSAHFAARQAA
jgi:3'-5' exoribonuclease